MISDKKLPSVVADVVGSRIIIWDIPSGQKIFKSGYFGKPVGIKKPKSTNFDRPLELTLLEALYLLQQGVITINLDDQQISEVKTFLEYCVANFDGFEDLYSVYFHLRSLRYIVKPGLKFGASFTVYRRGPGIDHAPFVVHVFPRNSRITPLNLVRAGRLATSVRKNYVLATVMPDKTVRYYVFQWFKP